MIKDFVIIALATIGLMISWTFAASAFNSADDLLALTGTVMAILTFAGWGALGWHIYNVYMKFTNGEDTITERKDNDE